jgi:putative methyltransferase (TIGR04325 family)
MLSRIPIVRDVLGALRRARFARHHPAGACCGVFTDFDQALTGVPAGIGVGYDCEAGADLAILGGSHLLHQINYRDYPLLFWLRKVLEGGARSLLDFGGHVGVKYYAYQRYLRLPPGFRWIVYDLPAQRRAGERLAASRGDAGAISFPDSVAAAQEVDLFFAAGSLQFERRPLWELLGDLARLPSSLLLSGVPMTKRESYVTLSSIGPNVVPYRIQNRDAFGSGLERLGYVLRDEWVAPEKHCCIVDRPDHSVRGYTGMFLSRPAPPAD